MIYLDNAATTRADDRVINYVNKYMLEFYANSSSLHKFGFDVENEILKINKKMLEYINANENSKILWTSGGTESNNMALRETARWKSRQGKHILSTKYEHPSVFRTLERLKNEGYEIEYVDIDKDGHVNINDLEKKIRKDTILVSIMHVNNEIGAINDIETIGNVIKEKNNCAIFHVDAIQSFGKLKIDVNKMHIDLLSTSGHKIHGPKGIGFLYIENNTKIKTFIEGGGQQNDLRSGTLNTPGIVGMYEATRIIYEDFDQIYKKITELNNYFLDCIKNKKYYALSKNNYSPYIISVIFPMVRSEVMLHALEEYDIYVGAGSACSSHKKHESEALKALGINNEFMDKMVRFSISRYNTKEEIDEVIKYIDQNYEKLVKFIKK